MAGYGKRPSIHPEPLGAVPDKRNPLPDPAPAHEMDILHPIDLRGNFLKGVGVMVSGDGKDIDARLLQTPEPFNQWS